MLDTQAGSHPLRLTSVSYEPLYFRLNAPIVELDFAQLVRAHHGLVVVRNSRISLGVDFRRDFD